MKRKKITSSIPVLFFLLLAVFLFAGCENTENVKACLDGKTYGFWNGLWHGIIAPIDLIAMLFNDEVSVFAVNNNGAWYSFGFLLGSGGWGIFGGKQLGKS